MTTEPSATTAPSTSDAALALRPATRFDPAVQTPAAYRALYKLQLAVEDCGLDSALVELLKVRASILNGCAFCIDLHVKDAVAAGESHRRLHAVGAWREAPFFTGPERSALALVDAVTLIAEQQVPDDVYAAAREHFSDEDVAR